MSKIIQRRGSQGKWHREPKRPLTPREIADLQEADATYKRKLYDHRPIQGSDMPEYKDAGH